MKFGFVTKEEILPYLDIVAQLRIQYFKEFPYLYEGNLAYEMQYLTSFASNTEATLALAMDGEQIIGFATGTSLVSEFDILKSANNQTLNLGIQNEKCCYIGEVIVDKKYRGLKIGSNLIKMQESHFKTKGYQTAAFLTVNREENHPLKPNNYLNPDIIWQKLGYTKTNQIIAFSWPVIQLNGGVLEQENELRFWVKEI